MLWSTKTVLWKHIFTGTGGKAILRKGGLRSQCAGQRVGAVLAEGRTVREEAGRGTGTESPRRPEPEHSRAACKMGLKWQVNQTSRALEAVLMRCTLGKRSQDVLCGACLFPCILFVSQSWEWPALNKRLDKLGVRELQPPQRVIHSLWVGLSCFPHNS